MATYIVNPKAHQEKAVEAFFAALEVSFTKDDNQEEGLPPHVIKGVKQGEADYEAGEYTSFADFTKKLHLFK
ncbi:hypothetical protein A0256_09260 [Mucilaginibacter sp. PAMC 26640]|nr:hypothetical protein A0256_09260 [Mucilaginibacter sp. PAMC 26640]